MSGGRKFLEKREEEVIWIKEYEEGQCTSKGVCARGMRVCGAKMKRGFVWLGESVYREVYSQTTVQVQMFCF